MNFHYRIRSLAILTLPLSLSGTKLSTGSRGFCSGSYQIRDNKSRYVPEAKRLHCGTGFPLSEGSGVIGETPHPVSRVTIAPSQFIPRLCDANALAGISDCTGLTIIL